MITQELELKENISQDVIFPPSDLYSDEPPVETELHLRQIILLFKCLEWLWKDRDDFYAAGNLTIYYSPNQKKSQYFRGPDFFVVLGTERKTRKSWVVPSSASRWCPVSMRPLTTSTAIPATIPTPSSRATTACGFKEARAVCVQFCAVVRVRGAPHFVFVLRRRRCEGEQRVATRGGAATTHEAIAIRAV